VKCLGGSWQLSTWVVGSLKSGSMYACLPTHPLFKKILASLLSTY
jgi:hypothetical protein